MRTLLPLLAFALVALAPAQNTKEIDTFVTQLMQKRGVPGVSVAVVQDGKVVYSKGYGFADVENSVPATADTVYQLGSVTKQFTAAIVMQLVEEGKVKLDEPARTYLTDLPEEWKAVTVRHLLTHTSGIKSYTEIPEFGKRMREPLEGSEFLTLVKAAKVDFEPGEKWKYNNSGYFLLGMLIEKITGKSFRDELHARILKPLGMTNTDMNDPRAIIKNRARGYDPSPDRGPRNAMYIDMGWPYSAGAMVSTVGDMAKWDAALYGDKPVKQASWKEAWTPVKLTTGKTFAYGFGWGIAKLNGVDVVEHGGDIPGFNADILRVPAKKLTVIVLCNADPGIAQPVAHGVAAIMDPSLKVQVKPVTDSDPKLTEAHKTLLLDLMKGTLKKDAFTDEMQAKLFPDAAANAQQFLKSLGEVDSFVLVNADNMDGAAIRAYSVKIGGQELRMVVVTNKAGKISGFTLSPG